MSSRIWYNTILLMLGLEIKVNLVIAMKEFLREI